VLHQYGLELDKRVRCHLKQTTDSWRVDETHIKLKGQLMYLYRVVDSEGDIIDFYLSQSRDKQAYKHSFQKALAVSHICKPRLITVIKEASLFNIN
jgi:transposase, IS6 family